jgi:serpin B
MQRFPQILCHTEKYFMQPRTFAGGLSTGLILCFALTLASCHKTISGPAVDTPLDLPAGSTTVTDAANRFAVTIFQQTLQTEPAGTNTLISPLSINLALDMVYNGAAGSTADSMATTLQLTGVPLGLVNNVSHDLLQQLPKEDTKVQLDFANSIWYKNTGPQPAATFKDTISSDYQGTAQAVDFSNPSTLNTVNNWVAKNTDNKIPQLLKALDPALEMLLVNAIFFNGSWQYGFQTSATKNEAFHRADGNTVTVPFMNQTNSFGFYSDSNATIVDMPYGTGKAFDMFLILPRDASQPINTFATRLSTSAFTGTLSSLDTTKITLSVPKWEYSYSIENMKPELTALGMSLAFGIGGTPNFSAMYPSYPVAISQVIHKTYIQVSESGTVAAAVTGVGMIGLAAPSQPVQITFDHPFLYLIRERGTGLILFVGVVNDPSQH